MRLSARRVVASVAAVLALTAATTPAPASWAGDTSRQGPLVLPAAEGGGSWTQLVYMVADNDLEPFALQDLQEMAQGAAAAGADTNILVLVDRLEVDWSLQYGEGADGAVGGLPAFDTAKLLRVTAEGFEEIGDYGEIDMGDPAVLQWFVHHGIAYAPADHYQLTLWDHGGGWSGGFIDEGGAWGSTDPTATPDRDLFSDLTVEEIYQGVSAGLAGAGVDRLDILGFDACLMASYEVASHLRPLARYLLASEEVEPGSGWDWTVMSTLGAQPDPVTLGSAIIDGYERAAGAEGPVTLSLVDLDQLVGVDQAMASFSAALQGEMPAAVPALARAIGTALPYHGGKTQTYDLGDLLRVLDTSGLSAGVQTAQSALYAALEAAVVDQVATDTLSQSTGLSVFFPASRETYPGALYETVQEQGQWRALLASYYDALEGGAGTGGTDGGEGATGDGTAQFTSPEATIESIGAEGVLMSADLQTGDGADVISAGFQVGVRAEGSTELAFLLPAAVGAGSPDTVQGSWAFDAMVLSNGNRSAVGTVEIAPQENGFRGSMPVTVIDSAGNRMPTLLLLDLDETLAPRSFAYYQSSGEAWAEYTPNEDDRVVPQTIYVGDDGQVSYVDAPGDPFRFESGVEPSLARLSAGQTFIGSLVVYDASGTPTSLASATGLIP